MNRKTQRMNQLMDILKMRGFVSIRELSQTLGVSEMTVRRDLKILEENRVAENIYGTSVYNPGHNVRKNEADSYDLLGAVEQLGARRESVARLAATLVERGDVIMIDAGNTTGRMAAFLPGNSQLTVVCSDINILMELRRSTGLQLLAPGGRFHADTGVFESEEGVHFVRGIRAQKLFLSASGVHETLGVTGRYSYQVPMKRAMLEGALQRILVADSAKFGLVEPSHLCELSDLSAVVSDSGLSPEWKERIEQMGIALYLAQ